MEAGKCYWRVLDSREIRFSAEGALTAVTARRIVYLHSKKQNSLKHLRILSNTCAAG